MLWIILTVILALVGVVVVDQTLNNLGAVIGICSIVSAVICAIIFVLRMVQIGFWA